MDTLGYQKNWWFFATSQSQFLWQERRTINPKLLKYGLFPKFPSFLWPICWSVGPLCEDYNFQCFFSPLITKRKYPLFTEQVTCFLQPQKKGKKKLPKWISSGFGQLRHYMENRPWCRGGMRYVSLCCFHFLAFRPNTWPMSKESKALRFQTEYLMIYWKRSQMSPEKRDQKREESPRNCRPWVY